MSISVVAPEVTDELRARLPAGVTEVVGRLDVCTGDLVVVLDAGADPGVVPALLDRVNDGAALAKVAGRGTNRALDALVNAIFGSSLRDVAGCGPVAFRRSLLRTVDLHPGADPYATVRVALRVAARGLRIDEIEGGSGGRISASLLRTLLDEVRRDRFEPVPDDHPEPVDSSHLLGARHAARRGPGRRRAGGRSPHDVATHRRTGPRSR